MSLILLVFGILITGAGVVAIAFGWTVSDSALGQSLIITGAITVVGGPLLMGAASLISQLGAIAESLRLRPTAQIPRLADARLPADSQRRPSEAFEPRLPDPRLPDPRLPDPRLPDPRPPEPRQGDPRQGDPRQAEPRQPEARPPDPSPTAAIEVSGSALERLRSTMRPDRVVANGEEVPLSPNGSGHHGPERNSEPRPEPEVRPGGPAETGKEPRLDFLFRPKMPPRPSQNPEQFDSMWPKRRPGDQSKPDEIARQPSSGGEPPRVEREPRSVAILKSGVVDGMAYTLYADGSIEAQLPHGTVRFGSIAELRAHIENNS
jgi:hypothetical protein